MDIAIQALNLLETTSSTFTGPILIWVVRRLYVLEKRVKIVEGWVRAKLLPKQYAEPEVDLEKVRDAAKGLFPTI